MRPPSDRLRSAVGDGSSIARGAIGASLSVSGLILGFNLITGTVLARALGPTSRGELAAVLLWPSLFAALGGLGVADAVAFHAARRTRPFATILGTGLAISAIQSAVLGFAALLVIPALLSARSVSTPGIVHISLLYIPLFLTADVLAWAMSGAQRLAWFQVLRFSLVAITTALLVGLWVAEALTVRSAVVATLASYVVVIPAAAVADLTIGGRDLRFRKDLASHLIAFGSKSHIAIASALLNQRVDQLVISVVLTPSALGQYVVAVAFGTLPAVVGASVALVALPQVAHLEAGPERAAVARRTVHVTLFASSAIAAVLLLSVQWLIRWLAGAAFGEAVNVARVLIVAGVFLSMSTTLSSLLRAVGEPLQAGIGSVVGLLVTGAGLFLCVPAFGIMGAACVSLVAYSVSATMMVRRAAGELGMPVRGLLYSASAADEWRESGGEAAPNVPDGT